jgi:hypothetical protein
MKWAPDGMEAQEYAIGQRGSVARPVALRFPDLSFRGADLIFPSFGGRSHLSVIPGRRVGEPGISF